LRPNPVFGPFYRFLKVRKNRYFGQDKVRKSQDFGFRNLRMNPATVPKQIVYCKVLFMSNFLNKHLNSEVSKLVSKFFPLVNLRLILNNPNSVSNKLRFFPFKDVIHLSVRSNIVYKYTCGICYSTYIGESTRHYSTRVAEHRGVSSWTELSVKNPKINVYSHIL